MNKLSYIHTKWVILILAILWFPVQYTHAQCTPAGEPSASCSGGNGEASNGQNINNGEIYWYASSGSLGNLSLNGGTFRVCGDLTINNMTYNSGTLIVEAGGVLNIENSMNLNGNISVTNYGTLSFLGDITMQNNNNVIVNKVGGVLNMQNFELELNSNTSRVINEGTANMGTLRIQSNNGGLCMGDNATLSTVDIFNNGPNSIEFPTGANSCISYSGTAQLNQPLTNSDRVFICQGATATTTGGSDFGSATVIPNCSSCAATPLPAELGDFKGYKLQQQTQLQWYTLSEINNDYFEIERSEDAVHFQTISQRITGKGKSNQPQHYQWLDPQPKLGINYYRLKQVDKLQNESAVSIKYSRVIAFNFGQEATAVVYPTSAQDHVTLTTQKISKGTPITIINALGQVIDQLLVTNTQQSINIKRYPRGVYLMQVVLPQQILWQRFVKR